MGLIITENSLITNIEDDSSARLDKEQEYLDYINEHISFVNKAFEMYMLPLLNMNNISTLVSDEKLKKAITDLQPLISTHDASKFSDAEFDGYRMRWHPTKTEEAKQKEDQELQVTIRERYEKCWEHHYTVNAHHPKHWVNPETGIAKDMSLDAIIEMLCDWEGMSLKFKTSTLKWYENNATDEKAAMSAKTREIVEDFLYNILHNSISKE